MRLKPEEAGMFYEIFLPLLDYVNENHHVIMELVHFTGESVDPRDAAAVAHFLWEHIECIDDYIAETLRKYYKTIRKLLWKHEKPVPNC